MQVPQNPDNKTHSEWCKKAEAVRKETERALSLEFNKEAQKGDVVFDEFSPSYQEAFALESEVKKAEGAVRAKADIEKEKKGLKAIAGMSLDELRAYRNSPEINIPDEVYIRMLKIIKNLRGLDKEQQVIELKNLPEKDKIFLRIAFRRQAFDNRWVELLSNEWFSDLESTIEDNTAEEPKEQVEEQRINKIA